MKLLKRDTFYTVVSFCDMESLRNTFTKFYPEGNRETEKRNVKVCLGKKYLYPSPSNINNTLQLTNKKKYT